MTTAQMRSVVAPTLTVLVVGAFASTGFAQLREWQGPNPMVGPDSGDWEIGTNWTPNGEPNGTGFDAHINLIGNQGSYIVTLSSVRPINNFEMLSADATLALSAAVLSMVGSYTQDSSQVTGSPGSMVAVAGLATLRNARIMDLAQFNASGALSFEGTGTTSIQNSTINHTGATATWQGANDLVFGGAASLSLGAASTMTITNDRLASGTGSLANAGTLRKNGGSGTTFFQGVQLNNTGTVRVDTGTLRFDTVSNITAGTLTGGTWRVEDAGVLDLGSSITTNQATIELNGMNSSFVSIQGLQNNNAAGTLRLTGGHSFTAQGSFNNTGTIDIQQGSSFRTNPATTLAAPNGTFTTSTGPMGLLVAAGDFNLQGTTISNLQVMTTGTVRFQGPVASSIDNGCMGNNGLGCLWDGTGGINLTGGSQMSFGSGTTFTLANQQTMTGTGGATLQVDGTMVRNDPGAVTNSTSITGVEVINNGTVRVQRGVLRADTVQNVAAGVLTGGTWDVRNGGTLDLMGQNVATNRATVTLDGATASFPALRNNIATNDTAGRLNIANGQVFVTPGPFRNNGTLSVVSATFRTPQLQNVVAGKITGGTIAVQSNGRADGRLEIDADIDNVDADITLDGATASIVNFNTNLDSLAPLNKIDSAGALTLLNARTVATLGDMTLATNAALNMDTGAQFMAGQDMFVQGTAAVMMGSDSMLDVTRDMTVEAAATLEVGSNSTTTVLRNLTNFGAGGSFDDGVFNINGGTLRAGNAVIMSLGNTVVLDSTARIENLNGDDAFETLRTITGTGRLTLRNGHDVTLTPHDLESFAGSTLTVGPVAAAPQDTRLRVQGNFVQLGTTTVNGGLLRIDGNYTQSGPTTLLNDGLIDVGGNYTNNSTLDLGGSTVTVGGDFINIGELIGSGIVNLMDGQRFVHSGIMSPGNSPGEIDILGGGDLFIKQNSEVRLDLAGLLAGTEHDLIHVDGAAIFDSMEAGRLVITLAPGYFPDEMDVFHVMEFDGGHEGWFASIVLPDHFVSILEDGRYSVMFIPAPASALMLGIGGLLAGRRRR